jgi:hypothetical protein
LIKVPSKQVSSFIGKLKEGILGFKGAGVLEQLHSSNVKPRRTLNDCIVFICITL